jgi:hypothetical protein
MRAMGAAWLMLAVPAVAAGRCETAAEAAALHTAALQQEMMVAAFQCADVAAYNDFVLSHRAALQQADRDLMTFFQRTAPQDPFGAYNLFKTELANASSLRVSTDRVFCARMAADFHAAAGRSLDQVLAEVPFVVDTGSVLCPWTPRAAIATPEPLPRKKRVRHRTWLGRLVDWLF